MAPASKGLQLISWPMMGRPPMLALLQMATSESPCSPRI